jgi:hypothetical protein
MDEAAGLLLDTRIIRTDAESGGVLLATHRHLQVGVLVDAKEDEARDHSDDDVDHHLRTIHLSTAEVM